MQNTETPVSRAFRLIVLYVNAGAHGAVETGQTHLVPQSLPMEGSHLNVASVASQQPPYLVDVHERHGGHTDDAAAAADYSAAGAAVATDAPAVPATHSAAVHEAQVSQAHNDRESDQFGGPSVEPLEPLEERAAAGRASEPPSDPPYVAAEPSIPLLEPSEELGHDSHEQHEHVVIEEHPPEHALENELPQENIEHADHVDQIVQVETEVANATDGIAVVSEELAQQHEAAPIAASERDPALNISSGEQLGGGLDVGASGGDATVATNRPTVGHDQGDQGHDQGDQGLDQGDRPLEDGPKAEDDADHFPEHEVQWGDHEKWSR